MQGCMAWLVLLFLYKRSQKAGAGVILCAGACSGEERWMQRCFWRLPVSTQGRGLPASPPGEGQGWPFLLSEFYIPLLNNLLAGCKLNTVPVCYGIQGARSFGNQW